MAFFRKRSNAARQLDEKLQRIQMNFENNYKDAAQLNLKEFETLLETCTQEGRLSDKEAAYYADTLKGLKERLKNFTHRDQKPYWT